MSRFIFITGGVVSSLGKGIASASLAAILEARGPARHPRGSRFGPSSACRSRSGAVRAQRRAMRRRPRASRLPSSVQSRTPRLAHHRRVGFNRGRARAACAAGSRCAGTRLATALSRPRAGPHRPRLVLARGAPDRALAWRLRAASLCRGRAAPRVRAARGGDGGRCRARRGGAASVRAASSSTSFVRSRRCATRRRFQLRTTRPPGWALCSRRCAIGALPVSSRPTPLSAVNGCSIECAPATARVRCCGGVGGDPRGPYTGAKIAYRGFPDMTRLRWLGLAGAGSVRALGLRSESPPRVRPASCGSRVC